MKSALQRFSVVSALLLSACTVPPSEEMIKDLISRHFETKNFRVRELAVGNIVPLQPSQVTYMGTEGYNVQIRRLSLEVTEDIGAPWNYRKGEILSFADATVLLKKRTGPEKSWTVNIVSGILIP